MTTVENPNSRSDKYVTYSFISLSAPAGAMAPETIAANLSDSRQRGHHEGNAAAPVLDRQTQQQRN